MLENVVAWVLNNYVGEYLENLNTDQLSFALLSGQLELENVPLKKTALQKFDVPLEVKIGVLGKLTLSIPLTRIRSEPWVLKLSDVFIIVGPRSQQRYDVETTEQTEQTKKEMMLNELEKKHCKQLFETMGITSTIVGEQESWWGASIIATVVNNIQLILTNVHIRYEDDHTLPNGHPFICGIRIQKMTVQTTNHHWKPGFVEPQEGVNVFKKLDLQGFSLYWNSNQPPAENASTIKDLQNLLSPEDAAANTYIVEPCSIELRMEKNASKLPLKGHPPIPRFKFWLKQERIIVELSRRQMSELRALNREWSRYERGRLHRKWRPVSGVNESAKEWWKFAYGRIIDETRRSNSRRTWSFALTRARHLNAYARAYRRRLLVLISNESARNIQDTPPQSDPTRPTLGTEERTIMKQIERDDQYTFNELHIFRETVFRKLLKEKEIELGLAPDSLEERTAGTDTPPEEQFERLESPVEEVALQPEPPKGQGIYGWITGFFTGKEKEATQEEPVFDFGHIDLQELKNVPPAFKEIEKQVEEEILDVLHDSWDDSTILRKDFLLAEVALKLDKLTLRFVDAKTTTSFEDRRVLAMDLIQVTSRVQLAPRTHTLNVSLSVHDMSIQRLITTCKRHREESMHTLEANDSLMYSNNENTKVLLAIGRGTQSTDLSKPLFKMQYRRRSPRLIVRHIVEGTFRPISLICDENALNGIGSVFEDDPEIAFAQNAITPLEELTKISSEPLQDNGYTPSIQLESHVFVDLNLPNICVVLRKKEWETGRVSKMNCNVEQFAKINIDDAHLSIISKEQFVNTVALDVGHMDIQDMFEKNQSMKTTTYPLLSTKKTRDLKAASTSCPNLNVIAQNGESFSTSLPNEGYLSALSTTCLNTKNDRLDVGVSRKASGAIKTSSTVFRSRIEASIRCTIIDSRHPEFETRFGKKNCSIDVNMNEVEVGMNRRSWTAMMDFVGLLGVNEEDLTSPRLSSGYTDLHKRSSLELIDVPTTKEPWLVACALHIKTLRINMNYPGNGTRLGVISFQELDLLNMIHLRDIREQLQLSLSFLGIRITDRTPGYSALYDERLVLLSENALKPLPIVQLNIVKFLGDVDLSRDHDLMIELIVPKQMHLYYIHTHRYFCALMDFWMQFFELQDHIIKQKKKYVIEGPKTRVKLKVDVQSPASIVLPQNQLSDEVILLKSTDIHISNTFKQSSSVLPIFKDSGVIVESDYDTRFANVDCLLDCIRVNFSNLEVHEAKRIERIFFKEETDSFSLGRDVFEHFEFMVATRPIFNERFDLVADLYRNLEGNLSRNLPDLTIITGIQGVTWQLSTDFYCLLRGFLQFNLADPLIPLPETIPIELLEKPGFSGEVGSENKYVTLSLRIFFENMKIDLLVPSVCTSSSNAKIRPPQSNMISSGVFFNRRYEPFARSHLPSAKVSFDVCIDGMAEFNLIAYHAQLEDKRKAPPGANLPVVHNIIVSPLASKTLNSSIDVMTEAAILFNKDQPPSVSLVLQGARVIVASDFLFDAKDFILLSPEFVPPLVDHFATEEPKRITSLQPNHTGVVDRISASIEAKQQTFELKITLKETDLYFLESSWSINSFALILSTEAVLKMNDQNGILTAALEISSIHVDWCLMDALDLTRSQCTNDFKLSVRLEAEEKEKMNNGLPFLVSQRHGIEVEINNAIGKLSLRDTRVFQVVFEGWLTHWNKTQGTSSIPIQPFKVLGKPLEIAKTRLSTNNNNFELWVLDDFRKDGCVPMVRCIFSDFVLEYSAERLVTSFTINFDYFNQRVYGWEPFIERWRILRLHLNQKGGVRSLELKTETKSTLDINLTQDFIQQVVQWKSRFVDVGLEFDRDEFRTQCSTRTRSDHLPYMLKNLTGSELAFTMQVDTFLAPNNQQRPATIKWLCVRENCEQDFEFPTKLLDYTARKNDSRQLIIRVDSWEECSPVNVDACGTYFRVVKAVQTGGLSARLVIKVTMEKDGKKVIVVQSSIELHNSLPHQITIFDEHKKAILSLNPAMTAPIPLKHAHTHFLVQPNCGWNFKELATVTWRNVRIPGEVVNQTIGLNSHEMEQYWLCYSIRREHYPEHEWLPGHTIWIVPPLSILNLLPVDMEIRLQDLMYAIGAGKQLDVSTIDINRELSFYFTTDRMVTSRDYVLNKGTIGDGQRVRIRLNDLQKRPLDVYAELKIARGGAISIVFWVPYWIINKSGIPLVIKQIAAPCEAAGQMEEHERAKDKHPLMFSFSAEDCPKRALIRVGQKFTTENGYTPEFSPQVELSPGVQDVKLKLTHPALPSLYYNIGIEVRAGTGRYRDTQVVLLTSRYILNNQSTNTLLIAHHDLIERASEHIHLAPASNTIWNENYENVRKLCVRRADVKHWSCPFRIDRVGSFHITMRDADETPRFVRVEVILSSAIFYVTFTDASYFPPPIQIENLSDVPVLYQQYSDSTTKQHLRTICKANSTIAYAWDDYAAREKLLLLQVYENRSHVYDPTIQGAGETLTYENNLYIQFSKSFKNQTKAKKTEECELVLETMQKGKIMLNKQNRLNGNDANQHWKLCDDGCIENIGMNNRMNKKQRMVLDVLESAGNQLMMCARNDRRDKYQRWNFLADGRICCGVAGMYITAGETDVFLSRREDRPAQVNDDLIDVNQVWNIQRQRPGSGKLDVECFHSGPTLVVRITDRMQNRALSQSVSMPLLSTKPSLAQMTKPQLATEIAITMRSGIGISIVNSLQEELVYALFGDIVINASKIGNTFQMTGSVGVIQADNQLLNADRWQFIYCHAGMADEENYVNPESLPAGVPTTARPALKIEMNCTPMKHYDAFDCFRLKLCDLSVQLDELLLWKFIQFVQATDASKRIQPSALEKPPSTELDRPNPLASKRCYFGTLELDMGQIALSVATIPKSGLSKDLRLLKQQFNIMLVSFENAGINLPPFRQLHYFETSSFLLELLKKFYFAELQKKVMNVAFYLDAFGNPAGFVTDLKDSFAGLFIEGDVRGFVSGVGYGVSNSISKVASSMAAGVGALTFDEEHEAKRRHNMLRSHSASTSTPLGHLYSGVKGLGMGFMGIITSIPTNTVQENKKSGIVAGTIRGFSTGLVDMVTKPVQGIFDLVDGTASAVRELAAPLAVKRPAAMSRIRLPRVCIDLHHQLPPYSQLLAWAQMEMLRINGYNQKERLLDVEMVIEQVTLEEVQRQYILISTDQCYVCKQLNGDSWTVLKRLAYKHVKSIQERETVNYLFPVEIMEEEDYSRLKTYHIWCARKDVAERVTEKLLIAKNEYDHNKRTLKEDDL